MKTLRYLLIVAAMVSFLSVCAQGLAQRPEAEMHSTSTMVGSGSTLPQAATTGALLTGETPGTYTPAKAPGMRKGSFNPGGEPGPDEGDNSEPWEDPIGDAMWPMMVLALVYGVWCRVYRRKRV